MYEVDEAAETISSYLKFVFLINNSYSLVPLSDLITRHTLSHLNLIVRTKK